MRLAIEEARAGAMVSLRTVSFLSDQRLSLSQDDDIVDRQRRVNLIRRDAGFSVRSSVFGAGMLVSLIKSSTPNNVDDEDSDDGHHSGSYHDDEASNNDESGDDNDNDDNESDYHRHVSGRSSRKSSSGIRNGRKRNSANKTSRRSSKRSNNNRLTVMVTQLPPIAGEGTAGAPSVFENVMASVLNGSQMAVEDLEMATAATTTTSAFNANSKQQLEEESYTFLKDVERLPNDLDELQRLSGSFNVTRSSLSHQSMGGVGPGGGGEEVCVRGAHQETAQHLRAFSVCILYAGSNRRQTERAHRRHRLRMAHRRAMEDAWRREVELVRLGFHGEWSAHEREELLRSGEVRGYVGQEWHSVHKFPRLAGQASNIRLVNEVKRG